MHHEVRVISVDISEIYSGHAGFPSWAEGATIAGGRRLAWAHLESSVVINTNWLEYDSETPVSAKDCRNTWFYRIGLSAAARALPRSPEDLVLLAQILDTRL